MACVDSAPPEPGVGVEKPSLQSGPSSVPVSSFRRCASCPSPSPCQLSPSPFSSVLLLWLGHRVSRLGSHQPSLHNCWAFPLPCCHFCATHSGAATSPQAHPLGNQEGGHSTSRHNQEHKVGNLKATATGSRSQSNKGSASRHGGVVGSEGTPTLPGQQTAVLVMVYLPRLSDSQGRTRTISAPRPGTSHLPAPLSSAVATALPSTPPGAEVLTNSWNHTVKACCGPRPTSARPIP